MKETCVHLKSIKKKVIHRNGKGRNLWFSHSHLHTIICMNNPIAIKVTAWVVNHSPRNRHNTNNFKLQVLLGKIRTCSKQLFKGKEYSAKYPEYFSPRILKKKKGHFVVFFSQGLSMLLSALCGSYLTSDLHY